MTTKCEIKGFEIPDDTDTAVTYVGQNGVVFSIQIQQDEHAMNPVEDCDCSGKIHSFSRRHGNFLDLHTADIEEAYEELNQRFGPEGEGWIRLGYFEHGNCKWFPIDNGIPPGTEHDFRWDGCSFAGVWEADKNVQDNLGNLQGKERYELLLKYCASVCEEYTNWCNGWVYGYSLTFPQTGATDSCGGFSGYDWEKNGLLESVLDVLHCQGISAVREIEPDEVFPALVEVADG